MDQLTTHVNLTAPEFAANAERMRALLEEYRERLAEWASGVTLRSHSNASELAERYVHLFFLRYHLAMNWTTSPIAPPFALTIHSMSELAPGANPVLDLLCEAILDGRQVLMPSEARVTA